MTYNWFAEQKITKLGLKRKEKLEGWKLNHLLRFSSPKIKLLEIGPGIGIFAQLCKEKVTEYYAIEPNQKLFEELVSKGFPVLKAAVPPIPYPDNSFNAVYMDQILEHMDGCKDALNLIKEAYRTLIPKGFICIITPNYLTEKELFFDIDYTHNFITTQRRVYQLLYDQGFKIVLSKKYTCGTTNWTANLLNILVMPIKLEFTRLFFSIFNLENLWLKIRKNLFELIIIIGQKPC